MRYESNWSGQICPGWRNPADWFIAPWLVIMRHSDLSQGKTLQLNQSVRYRRNRSVTLLASILAVITAGCEQPRPDVAATAEYGCGSDGHLSTELFGGLQTDLEWNAGVLVCEGMPRPDNEGARLRLSGPVDDAPDAQIVAIILGIPALAEGRTGRELPTNVTLIEEGAGRFFSTPDMSGCWTDIDRHELASDASPSVYRVSGTVYCVSPLAELNGGTSISFTELTFTGRLDWELPE